MSFKFKVQSVKGITMHFHRNVTSFAVSFHVAQGKRLTTYNRNLLQFDQRGP